MQRPDHCGGFFNADTGIFCHWCGIGQRIAHAVKISGGFVHRHGENIPDMSDLIV
ncbi:Uncharacterised protein [Shigella sonnei]|nr:Uncharacterised protein [Shigella sonnei]